MRKRKERERKKKRKEGRDGKGWFQGKGRAQSERTNFIVLRATGIEPVRVIANWVLYWLDCGHLVRNLDDFAVKIYLPSGERIFSRFSTCIAFLACVYLRRDVWVPRRLINQLAIRQCLTRPKLMFQREHIVPFRFTRRHNSTLTTFIVIFLSFCS